MAVKVGYNCDVDLGGASVSAMGAWALTGIAADQIETTSFKDTRS